MDGWMDGWMGERMSEWIPVVSAGIGAPHVHGVRQTDVLIEAAIGWVIARIRSPANSAVRGSDMGQPIDR